MTTYFREICDMKLRRRVRRRNRRWVRAARYQGIPMFDYFQRQFAKQGAE